MNEPFGGESVSSVYQPLTKKVKLTPPSSKSAPVSNLKQLSFTMADVQKCLFNVSTVHPIHSREALGKKDGAGCFCKCFVWVLFARNDALNSVSMDFFKKSKPGGVCSFHTSYNSTKFS